ncbi:MAG TPA: aminoglycoside phosphotransferase [Propionibacteriaceae bacterium]|jgi:aminoglycoside phosphotransferase (APT) family kinase protein|nr:aminoglycoside phosphotransferase [Propionibacteriaceae bacterium]HBY22129.1 aminoglycoside phosphotransferase [Propionibacteriaceae bacterium]
MVAVPTIPAADWAITPQLVAQLLADQCPDLAGRAVTPFSHGWDNVMYRLGDDLVIRLPRRRAAVTLIENEIRWLPTIAGSLPAFTSLPVFVGSATDDYPTRWTVAPFAHARTAADVAVSERTPAAEGLADFFVALHRTAPVNAPANPGRGTALGRPEMQARVLDRIGRRPAQSAALADRWRAWSGAPGWSGPTVWLHGDAHPLNLLLDHDGRLAGVIDWGDITSGDPACDLAVGWLMFDEAGRRRFTERGAPNPAYDADIWTRAKAWGLYFGLFFAEQADDMPRLQRIGEDALARLLDEPLG